MTLEPTQHSDALSSESFLSNSKTYSFPAVFEGIERGCQWKRLHEDHGRGTQIEWMASAHLHQDFKAALMQALHELIKLLCSRLWLTPCCIATVGNEVGEGRQPLHHTARS